MLDIHNPGRQRTCWSRLCGRIYFILTFMFKVPEEEGVHELQFVYSFDPYQDLDNVTDVFVQSVMRSALIVEDGE